MSQKSDEWAEFFGQSAPACLGAGIVAAVGLLVVQIVIYLQTAVWKKYPLAIIVDIGEREEWENKLGFYEIFSWMLQLPLSLAMFFTGAILFFVFSWAELEINRRAN